MDVRDANIVKGFLIPEFTETLPDGRTLNGLTEEGFNMVVAGYACGECLAYFSTFKLICPVCKKMRDPGEIRSAPQLWVDHLAERYSDEPFVKPEVSIEAALKRVSNDPDVEQIPLAKLRPSKHGRGRMN